MNNVITQNAPQTEGEQESEFRQLLAEMGRLEELMDKDRAESERLKMEAALIKAETQTIKERTNANLARLQEQINLLSKAA